MLESAQKDRLAAAVERMIARFRREDVNMHGFLLSVDGRLAAQAYYPPFREGQPHRMYSVSKTLTGIAVGMLADDGLLALDDPICRYFEDWLPPRPDERLTALTIRDMLRMATCYRWTAYREGVDENWAKMFFISQPTHAPGTVFYYDTGCSQALAELVRRRSGMGVLDFLNRRLFGPLGANDPKYWLRDPSGCEQGGTGLCMSLRDMHRVAQCLLDGGEGIVPAWFAAEMGEKHIDTPLQTNEEERYGYGWQCWRTRAGWAMYGMGGQLAILCPDKRAVLSTIADTRLDPFGVQRIYNAFFEEVYPCLDAGAPETPRVYTPAMRPLDDRSGRALTEAGPYVFPADNPLGLKRLSLRDGRLCYENRRGSCVLPVCPGVVTQAAFPGWPDVPALVSAGWTADGALRLRCFAIGDAPCGFDLLAAFGDGGVTVQTRMSHDPMTRDYDGVVSGTIEP